jgi:transposase
MISEDEQERLRRAYYVEHRSLRAISQTTGHCYRTIVAALDGRSCLREPRHTHPRSAPVFGPYRAQVEQWLTQNDQLPHKQRYTAHRIYQLLREDGYSGCESSVRQYVSGWRHEHQSVDTFLPLEFGPGEDGQVDWGEAMALMAGERHTVQLFIMRLCYSRRTFVMAFPSQNQESFFYGHVCAFAYFGGVPARLSYDNLATAVKLALDAGARRRHERRTFVSFRSHYLFDSHFCTPGQGHEKGSVESAVGYVRRNYLVPVPEVASFDDLNLQLRQRCLQEDQRRLRGMPLSIGAAWEQERPCLRPLPPFAYDCCTLTTAHLTPYSQVVFETNRYSVPVNRARREVTVKAYPFHVDLLDGTTLLARHARCYSREQDIFDPLHYLPLVEQRPGAFDYAKPMRQWRAVWPATYHQALRLLREKWPDGRGVQEFVRILRLHQDHPAALVEQAVHQALVYGCVHLDGVLHCLHHLALPSDASDAETAPAPLDLAPHPEEHQPEWSGVGSQAIDLARYDLLLKSTR